MMPAMIPTMSPSMISARTRHHQPASGTPSGVVAGGFTPAYAVP